MGNHHETHQKEYKVANTKGHDRRIGPICHLRVRARNPGQTLVKMKRTLEKVWLDTKPSQEQIFHMVPNS